MIAITYVHCIYDKPGVTTYRIAWMLQTRSMAPTLTYNVSFSLRKIMQISICQTKQCRRCLTSHLNRIYNSHAQKFQCLCNHSPTNIEAGDTMMILAEM